MLADMTPPWVFRATAVNCWVCAATSVAVSGEIVTLASRSGGGGVGGIAAGGPDVTTILVESFPRPAPAVATI
jgi:hypothetical protein